MPFQIRPDAAENRPYLTLQGLISDEDAVACVAAVFESVPHLRRGFHVINDLTTFRPLTQAGVEAIKRATSPWRRWA